MELVVGKQVDCRREFANSGEELENGHRVDLGVGREIARSGSVGKPGLDVVEPGAAGSRVLDEDARRTTTGKAGQLRQDLWPPIRIDGAIIDMLKKH